MAVRPLNLGALVHVEATVVKVKECHRAYIKSWETSICDDMFSHMTACTDEDHRSGTLIAFIYQGEGSHGDKLPGDHS